MFRAGGCVFFPSAFVIFLCSPNSMFCSFLDDSSAREMVHTEFNTGHQNRIVCRGIHCHTEREKDDNKGTSSEGFRIILKTYTHFNPT